MRGMNSRFFRKIILACASCVLISCGSSVEGTYTDGRGGFELELKSGGEATMKVSDAKGSCTYKSGGGGDGNKIKMNCPGQAGDFSFTVNADGSLTQSRE